MTRGGIVLLAIIGFVACLGFVVLGTATQPQKKAEPEIGKNCHFASGCLGEGIPKVPYDILDVTLVTFGLTVDGAKQIEAIPIGSGEMWSQTLEDFKYLCKHWQRSREITYHPPKPYLAAAHICKVERRK